MLAAQAFRRPYVNEILHFSAHNISLSLSRSRFISPRFLNWTGLQSVTTYSGTIMYKLNGDYFSLGPHIKLLSNFRNNFFYSHTLPIQHAYTLQYGRYFTTNSLSLSLSGHLPLKRCAPIMKFYKLNAHCYILSVYSCLLFNNNNPAAASHICIIYIYI